MIGWLEGLLIAAGVICCLFFSAAIWKRIFGQVQESVEFTQDKIEAMKDRKSEKKVPSGADRA